MSVSDHEWEALKSSVQEMREVACLCIGLLKLDDHQPDEDLYHAFMLDGILGWTSCQAACALRAMSEGKEIPKAALDGMRTTLGVGKP